MQRLAKLLQFVRWTTIDIEIEEILQRVVVFDVVFVVLLDSRKGKDNV